MVKVSALLALMTARPGLRLLSMLQLPSMYRDCTIMSSAYRIATNLNDPPPKQNAERCDHHTEEGLSAIRKYGGGWGRGATCSECKSKWRITPKIKDTRTRDVWTLVEVNGIKVTARVDHMAEQPARVRPGVRRRCGQNAATTAAPRLSPSSPLSSSVSVPAFSEATSAAPHRSVTSATAMAEEENMFGVTSLERIYSFSLPAASSNPVSLSPVDRRLDDPESIEMSDEEYDWAHVTSS